jgi:hypothetical protein
MTGNLTNSCVKLLLLQNSDNYYSKQWNNNIKTVLETSWVKSCVSDTLDFAQAEPEVVSEIQDLKIC